MTVAKISCMLNWHCIINKSTLKIKNRATKFIMNISVVVKKQWPLFRLKHFKSSCYHKISAIRKQLPSSHKLTLKCKIKFTNIIPIFHLIQSKNSWCTTYILTKYSNAGNWDTKHIMNISGKRKNKDVH